LERVGEIIGMTPSFLQGLDGAGELGGELLHVLLAVEVDDAVLHLVGLGLLVLDDHGDLVLVLVGLLEHRLGLGELSHNVGVVEDLADGVLEDQLEYHQLLVTLAEGALLDGDLALPAVALLGQLYLQFLHLLLVHLLEGALFLLLVLQLHEGGRLVFSLNGAVRVIALLLALLLLAENVGLVRVSEEGVVRVEQGLLLSPAGRRREPREEALLPRGLPEPSKETSPSTLSCPSEEGARCWGASEHRPPRGGSRAEEPHLGAGLIALSRLLLVSIGLLGSGCVSKERLGRGLGVAEEARVCPGGLVTLAEEATRLIIIIGAQEAERDGGMGACPEVE